MSKISGGHLVAKYLSEVEGVSTVFSIPGGHIDRIYDGFLEYVTKLIVVRLSLIHISEPTRPY